MCWVEGSTANPLWISLEGFLEELVLDLNVGSTGLAPGPSHHGLGVTRIHPPSACPPCPVHNSRGQEGGMFCCGSRGVLAQVSMGTPGPSGRSFAGSLGQSLAKLGPLGVVLTLPHLFLPANKWFEKVIRPPGVRTLGGCLLGATRSAQLEKLCPGVS